MSHVRNSTRSPVGGKALCQTLALCKTLWRNSLELKLLSFALSGGTICGLTLSTLSLDGCTRICCPLPCRCQDGHQNV